MIRYVIALLLALAANGAWAADESGKRPSESDTPTGIDDAEALARRGVAVDAVATRDTDNFERNIARVGAMVRYESVNDFVALGASSNEFRQGSWSMRVNSIVASMRKVERATAAGYNLRLALAFKGDKTDLHGEGGWNIRFSETTGVELIANRDAIETQQALQSRILATFVAASFDHAVTERLSVIAMPTYRHFTDGNEQPGLRGWVIYGLVPEQGLSMSVKARTYRSTQDGGGAYFSPANYDRGEIGLRLRRAVGNWRVYATADLGKERINRDVEKPTRQLVLSTQRNFDNNLSVGLQFAYYRASDSANNLGGATDVYAWRMARLYVTIPY